MAKQRRKKGKHWVVSICFSCFHSFSLHISLILPSLYVSLLPKPEAASISCGIEFHQFIVPHLKKSFPPSVLNSESQMWKGEVESKMGWSLGQNVQQQLCTLCSRWPSEFMLWGRSQLPSLRKGDGIFHHCKRTSYSVQLICFIEAIYNVQKKMYSRQETEIYILKTPNGKKIANFAESFFSRIRQSVS